MELIEIESRLYAALEPGKPQIKIAMMIARAFKGENLPSEEDINKAIKILIEREDIKTFGIVENWRHSEVLIA